MPDISLKTYSGGTYTASSEDTQVTLVVFWATWCRPCLMEIPALVQLQQKYQDRQFRVVGVNTDDPTGAKALPIMKMMGVNYQMVIGDDKIAGKFGGVWGLPTSFLVGRDGLIKEKFQGLWPVEVLDEKITAQL